MLFLKIAVRLNNLGLPFRKALPVAAELGSCAVEIDARGELNCEQLSQTGIRQIRKLLEDYGQRVSAVSFYTRHGYCEPQLLEARVQGTRNAMRFAQRLGANVVVNRIGRLPVVDSPEWKTLGEVLNDLAAYGARCGALLAAETGNESGEELARALRLAPEGTIAADLNPGNLVSAGHDPVAAIAALGPMILHAHVKDAVRDLGAGFGGEVQLGRGSVDFPAVLAALEDHGYRGYFTIQRDHAQDPARELSDAVAYLKNLGR